MKQFHFISGLPRSGSRLLVNILAQNPRFYPGAPSGLLNTLFGVRNGWDDTIEHRSMPEYVSETHKIRVMRGIMTSYYGFTDKPVVFDLSRGWLGHLEMLEYILGEPAKILVTVRDLREVLASMESIWRRTSGNKQMGQERKYYVQMQSIAGRCDVWLKDDQPVGIAYNRVADAIMRGYPDRLHFVSFERLTIDPEMVMGGVYEFLGEESYTHDFDNVEQVTIEDDRVHGIDGLHTIRHKVAPVPTKRHILGQAADAYQGPYIWDQFLNMDRRNKGTK